MSRKVNYDGWNREQLVSEVERLRKRKKYGLVWEEKPEDVVEQCKQELPVLEEVKNKEIITDPKGPVNILIEGDNYHALSVLNYTHKGKIDVIYIDPPYNTGAKDWKYNNDFVDTNDIYRHSKWLSFMEKRLRLAKKLLKRNGVLICTIDENEQSNLGVLLNELFYDREITCVVIVHNPAGIQGKNFSYCHEYAYFVYPKNGRFINLQDREENPDIRPLRNVSGPGANNAHLRESAANCFYPIFVKERKIIGFGNVCRENYHPKSANIRRRDGVIEIYPIDARGNERKWVFARQSVEAIRDELSAEYNKRRGIWDIIRKKQKFNYKTVWDDTKYNATILGTQLVNNIIDSKFPFPKSLYAVEECIRAVIHDKNEAVILDFFAGSGTTGHAVLELNKEDNGKRRFILCTNNEDNNGDGKKIADDMCYPRVKKVIEGYTGLLDGKIYKGLGGNLKYFRTAFVGAEPTDKNKKALTRKAVEMLCLREDTFEPVKDTGPFKIFRNGKRYTGIVFNQTALTDFKKTIANMDGVWSVYIFSLGDDTFEGEFEGMKQKITVSPIPEAILRVYRRIFK